MSSYNELLAAHGCLESEHLHLRPAGLEGAPALFAMSQRAEVLKYRTWQVDESLADTK